MRHIENGIYSQQYYSEDFFLLYEVMDFESERLCNHDVLVINHEIRLSERNGELLFFLVLFFKSSSGTNLKSKEDELFNHKYK
jgi:hypothetical protein